MTRISTISQLAVDYLANKGVLVVRAAVDNDPAIAIDNRSGH